MTGCRATVRVLVARGLRIKSRCRVHVRARSACKIIVSFRFKFKKYGCYLLNSSAIVRIVCKRIAQSVNTSFLRGPSASIMLTMPPGALQGQRSVGPPKVVGELLKGSSAGLVAVREGTTDATAVARKRGGALGQGASSGTPAAAAMVLAKDMATGRKSSSAAAASSQSPRVVAAARGSGIPIRPKPVTPSASRKTAVDGRKQLRPNKTCRRPTSVERVKVHSALHKLNITALDICTVVACRE